MLLEKFQNPRINIDRYFQFLPEGKGRADNIPGNSQTKLRKITLPEQEIYLYWPNLSMKVNQIKD